MTIATDKADGTIATGDHASHHNSLAAAVNSITQGSGIVDAGGQVYNVIAYGLIGDGTTDNSPLLTTLLATVGRNATLFFPKPATYYLFKSTVDVPRANDYCRFLGPGVGRYFSRPNTGGATILRRSFNGAIFTIEALGCEFDHLAFDADGPTYTGSLFQITTCPDRIYISNCGFFNINTYGVEFTTGGSGIKSWIQSCVFDPQSGGGTVIGSYAGIRLPNDNPSAGDRFIIDCIATSGSILVELNNSVNTNIVGCSMMNISFPVGNSGTHSVKCTIVGSRLALTGGTLTIHGNQHALIGNTINGGSIVFAGDSSDCVSLNAVPDVHSYTITNTGNRNKILDLFPTLATGAAHTVDEVITVLQNIGLVKQS